jgi:FKBP12-rapamycin complex-associated protein
LTVLQSKRRPRKLTIWGDDEKMYNFCLKGGEDLRQDERVMQLLNLVNNLLRKDEQTEKRDLRIITFPVIPLTTNTGILGWVQNCDTLQELISSYRELNHVAPDGEKK